MTNDFNAEILVQEYFFLCFLFSLLSFSQAVHMYNLHVKHKLALC